MLAYPLLYCCYRYYGSVTLLGSGQYGGPVRTTFLKTHGLTYLPNAFFNADHDELNEIYDFSKELIPPMGVTLETHLGCKSKLGPEVTLIIAMAAVLHLPTQHR